MTTYAQHNARSFENHSASMETVPVADRMNRDWSEYRHAPDHFVATRLDADHANIVPNYDVVDSGRDYDYDALMALYPNLRSE